MEMIFAVLLGAGAVWCLWSAFRSYRSSGREAAGYVVAGVSAIVQVFNILGRLGSSYSIVISIITTIGLLGGFAMTRNPARTEPKV